VKETILLKDDPLILNIALYETPIRAWVLIGLFFLLAIWEWRAPRRPLKIHRLDRWPQIISLTSMNAFILYLLFPGACLWFAYWAYYNQFGLFYQLQLPLWIGNLVGFFLLDLTIYLQHRLYHLSPSFWAFHRMHHSDLEMDVTTGVRFHPFELVFSLLVKASVIILLGLPILGVFLFEVALHASLLFAHSNIRLSPTLNKILCRLIVTPDMHRIHHSAKLVETDSNFSFIFSWWDNLFKTYRSQPSSSHEKMALGLSVFHEQKYRRVDQLLIQPFLNKKGRFDLRHFLRK
jgi:sterol desaturase/sphingolipid hydroxylase (fatty acid hydroxylase superfamily)